MNLRQIVPALGLVAMTSASAFAADAAPAVTFQGWVDTILTYSDNDTEDDDTTATDESSGSLRFSSDASLKANWKVTDALTARINLWFDAEFADLQMREAYFAYAINDTVTWSMGKYIDHLGWLSAEPTGLYTINATLIGYTAPYGNDVLGTSIGVAPKGSPLSGSFHITNGYYTGSAASNGGESDYRENTDLGFGLDLIFALPNDLGSVNLEFAYDMGSENTPINDNATPADPTDDFKEDGLGGDVLVVGLNATIKPVKPLMIGAEFQYQAFSEAEEVDGTEFADSDSTRMQGLLLANFAFEGTPVPMSVTGMVQYVTIDTNADDDEARMGVAVALLTNPLTSSNFGLNFEVGFWDISDEGGVAGADSDGINVAVEGLVTF